MAHRRPDVRVWTLALLFPALLIAAWLGPLMATPGRSEAAVGEGFVEPLSSGGEVLVVGNSLSQYGVDRERLAAALGATEGVDLVWFPGAAAPTWYAALKNGVFAHGGRPKLVIVVNTLRMMLSVDIPEDRRLADFRALLTEEEPVIATKVFQSTAFDSPWARARARRSEPRDAYIDGFKRLPYLFDADPLGRANQAIEGVFGGQNIAGAEDRQRMIPIVEMRESAPGPLTSEIAPEASLIPDLVELAQGHGAKIVFARVPIPRSGRKYWPLTSLAEDQAVVAMLNELGAGYIDLHDLPLSESDFVDDHHLGRTGQLTFTQHLSDALVELGAMEEGPMRAAELPTSFRAARRVGTPVAVVHDPPVVSGCDVFVPIREPFLGLSNTRLEFLGLGPASPVVGLQRGRAVSQAAAMSESGTCGGSSYHRLRGLQIDARGTSAPEQWSVALSDELPSSSGTWWVYPGTSIELDFDASGVEASRVGLVALQVTRSDARPTLQVSNVQVPLQKFGMRWVGISDTVSLDADWSLSLSSPEDGPFLVLTMLATRNGPDASFVVGGPEDMNNTLRFLGTRTMSVRHARRTQDIRQGPVEIEPGSLPSIRVEGARGVTSRALRQWADTRQAGVEAPTPRVMAKCSPLQILEDGAPLEAVEAVPLLRGPEGLGKYTSFDDQVVLRPSVGAPAEHHYQVVLGGRRWCRNHLYWLYPGDRASMGLTEPGRLHAGAGRLVVGAFVFGDPDAAIGLRFHAGSDVVLETEVRAGDLDGEPMTLPFTERIPPATRNLRLEWTLPEDGPFLLVNFGLLAP